MNVGVVVCLLLQYYTVGRCRTRVEGRKQATERDSSRTVGGDKGISFFLRTRSWYFFFTRAIDGRPVSVSTAYYLFQDGSMYRGCEGQVEADVGQTGE
jgi:hypothetical protein